MTAFERDVSRCPWCRAKRPDNGWTRTCDVPDHWLGRVVDNRYRLHGRIGQGTAGAVYRATRAQLSGYYAIKVISLNNPNFGGAGVEALERIEREVKIMSRISSPHVVEFHDFLELPGETVAIVMDYVDGGELAELLDRLGALELERALHIALDIAIGFRTLHDAGAVHRDLKPENVMLQSVGRGEEMAEVIDFGIVEFVAEPTATYGFIGTPLYTSPEQARDEPVDARSDIYNLGMLLFHMVTGHPPFEHDSVRSLLVAHAHEQSPSPTDSRGGGGLPGELETLIVSMMAKKPDHRPESMQVVIDRLQAILADYEIPGLTPPTSEPRVREPVPRTPKSEAEDEDEATSTQHAWRSDDVLRGDGDGAGEMPGSTDEFDELLEQVRDTFSEEALDDVLPESGTDRITAVAEMDGTAVALGFHSGGAYLATDGPERWRLLSTGAEVVAIDYHHGERTLAVTAADCTTQVRFLSSWESAPPLVIEHESLPVDMCLSSDGYLVAVEFGERRVEVYSSLGGRLIAERTRTGADVSSVFDEGVSGI